VSWIIDGFVDGIRWLAEHRDPSFDEPSRAGNDSSGRRDAMRRLPFAAVRREEPPLREPVGNGPLPAPLA
jgi:hypothetical protein